MYNTLIVGGIGFFTAWMGILAGILASFFINKGSKSIKGLAFGFIGGLMLAIVFFDLIPESIGTSNVYTASFGIIIGLMASMLLEGKLDFKHIDSKSRQYSGLLKSGIFMAIAIGIHHLPIGFALGSLLSINPIKGINLAIIIVLHGLPEGLALGIFFNESKIGFFSLVLVSIFTSIPMGLGAILGGELSQVSPSIISISIAFAAGMILYVVTSETLPLASQTRKGRLSTAAIVFGVIAGIIIISLFG